MGTRTAYRVTEEFIHVMPPSKHFKGMDYPIYTDDELALESIDQATLIGTFTKVCPGLCICGIKIPMELVEKHEESRQIVLM